jgi:hypothetical protein
VGKEGVGEEEWWAPGPQVWASQGCFGYTFRSGTVLRRTHEACHSRLLHSSGMSGPGTCTRDCAHTQDSIVAAAVCGAGVRGPVEQLDASAGAASLQPWHGQHGVGRAGPHALPLPRRGEPTGHCMAWQGGSMLLRAQPRFLLRFEAHLLNPDLASYRA